MLTARRLYVYLISGITLGVLLAGLHTLLRIALDAVGLGSGSDVIVGEASRAEQLSGALALVAVGAPVWFIHWGWMERNLRHGHASAAEERASALRGLYLTLVLFALLGFIATAVSSLVTLGVTVASGGDPLESPPAPVVADQAAAVVIGSLAFGYHAWVRRRDLATGPVERAAAWLPRAYLYGAALVGVVALALGLTDLVTVAVQAALGASPPLIDSGGPQLGLAGSVGLTTTAAVVWLGHLAYAVGLMRSGGWRGVAERPSRVRLGYLVVVLALAASAALGSLADVGSAALEAATGSLVASGGLPALIVGPSILAVLFGVGAALHIGWMRTDARRLSDASDGGADTERLATVWRLERYVLALTGLSFAAAGVAGLIGVTVRSLAAGAPLGAGGDMLLTELAVHVPQAVLGGLVWVLTWLQVIRRTAAAPEVEAAAAVRRIALLAVLAVSVVAGVAALAFILYRLFVTMLGGDLIAAAVAELAMPMGVLLTALALGLYHGTLLRRDTELVRSAAKPATALEEGVVAADVWESEGGTVVPAAMSLTLVGPDGADLEAALRAARDALPEGYLLKRD